MKLFLNLTAAVLLAAPAAAQVAVRGGTVYPVSGAPIADGVVVVTGGRIAAVGPAAEITIPAGYEVLEAAVVTPGLVDVHGTVGLTGIFNQAHDQDHLETSEKMQPELRAVDAYNPQEALVAWVRSFGVTTVHTGHSPGAPISGQTMVVKTRGATVDEAALQRETAVAVTLTPPAGPFGGSKMFTTRAKTVALLRQDLIRADELRRLKTCAAPDCEAVLIDLSRNRSRMFCDTGNCGNRQHVAAYRERRSKDH